VHASGKPHTKTPLSPRKAGVPLLAWLGIAVPVVVLGGLILLGTSGALNAWERSRLGPLHRAAWDGDVAECERLVKEGSAVDATDGGGVTALSWAVFHCNVDVVRKLIELGADANHVDNRGRLTPLMYTATTLRGHKLHGSQEQRTEIAHLLIRHGADVNRAMGDGRTIGSGQTTLHFAAKDKNVDLVRVLVAAGADPNLKESHGWTPLDIAKFPDYAPNDEVIRALESAR
jgi:ankyrin repeat protein